MTFTNFGTKRSVGFQCQGEQRREKSGSVTETWVGAVWVKGLLVEGMPCSFLSSAKMFQNCRARWCSRDWRILCFIVLEHTLLLHFGACGVNDVLFSVCKLFAKHIFL